MPIQPTTPHFSRPSLSFGLSSHCESITPKKYPDDLGRRRISEGMHQRSNRGLGKRTSYRATINRELTLGYPALAQFV